MTKTTSCDGQNKELRRMYYYTYTSQTHRFFGCLRDHIFNENSNNCFNYNILFVYVSVEGELGRLLSLETVATPLHYNFVNIYILLWTL